MVTCLVLVCVLVPAAAAVINGIIVCRAGEFTCPVGVGAIYMAALPLQQQQHLAGTPEQPQLYRAQQQQQQRCDSSGSGELPLSGAATGAGASAGTTAAPGAAPKASAAASAAGGFLAGLAQQPFVSALDGVTDAAAVLAAAEAGALPAVVAHTRMPGVGEFIEFRRPQHPAAPGEQHQLQPVVWFR